jgi:hypothetical protein
MDEGEVSSTGDRPAGEKILWDVTRYCDGHLRVMSDKMCGHWSVSCAARDAAAA